MKRIDRLPTARTLSIPRAMWPVVVRDMPAYHILFDVHAAVQGHAPPGLLITVPFLISLVTIFLAEMAKIPTILIVHACSASVTPRATSLPS